MGWLQFILALAAGREHAVIVARVNDLSSMETFFLAAAWYLTLGCLVVYFVDHPRIDRKLAKVRDARWCRRLIRAIATEWRVPIAFVLCLAPNGFWLVILLMTFWQYRWYQRILLAAVGSTASYFAYDAAMAPVLKLLGPYVLLAIPVILIVGLIIKQREALTGWSVQRYRLIVAKATS
jgi:hypothetical protein